MNSWTSGKTRAPVFLVFVSFIYPKVGSEEAGNLKTPTEMDKIRTNDRILSPTKRPGEGQLSKTETFRKYLLNIRKTPQKIVTPPPPTTSTKAKGKVQIVCQSCKVVMNCLNTSLRIVLDKKKSGTRTCIPICS